MISDSLSAKPHLFHVGFRALYGSKHIPGSIYAGPGAEKDGIEKLKSATNVLPKDADIVLYCGCCPWSNCPNVRPAFAALHKDGFTNVRVLMIDENMQKDWIEKGYPIE
jgi:rhodanese-related sulfurtransferase